MGFGETLREFKVKVGIDYDQRKIEQAEYAIKKLSDKLKSFALELSAVTGGLFAMAKGSTAYARNIKEQADLIGISTDALQEYAYTAKVLAGVNEDELAGSLENINELLDKSRTGDLDARKALQQLQDITGKPIFDKMASGTYTATDALDDLSGAIEMVYKNSPQSAARLTQMFTGNEKLVNMLNKGPIAIHKMNDEAKKNAIVSKSMIEAGYKLDVQLSKLYALLRKIGVELGIITMKRLYPMIEKMVMWIDKNKDLIASGVVDFLDDLKEGFDLAVEGVTKLHEELAPMLEKIGGAKAGIKDLIAALIVWKGLEVAGAIFETTKGIAEMGHMLLKIIPSIWAFIAAKTAMNGASAAGEVADMAGAYSAAGMGAKGVLGSGMGILGASGAVLGAGALGYGIGTLINAGLEKLAPGGISNWINNKLNPELSTEAITSGLAAPATFNTNVTVTVPHGTSPNMAAKMVTKGVTDAHEATIRKAGSNAQRNRTQ
jgi:hypothetical protein